VAGFVFLYILGLLCLVASASLLTAYRLPNVVFMLAQGRASLVLANKFKQVASRICAQPGSQKGKHLSVRRGETEGLLGAQNSQQVSVLMLFEGDLWWLVTMVEDLMLLADIRDLYAIWEYFEEFG